MYDTSLLKKMLTGFSRKKRTVINYGDICGRLSKDAETLEVESSMCITDT